MGKRSELTFFQRRYTNDQQGHEKMFSVISHQGNADQNHSEIPIHYHWDGYNPSHITASVDEDADKWQSQNPHILLVGMQNCTAALKNVHILSRPAQFLKRWVTIKPSNYIPRNIHKRNEKICPHKKLYTNAYSSIINNGQKGTNKPNVHQLING